MDQGSTPSPNAAATHDASSRPSSQSSSWASSWASSVPPSDVEACHALIVQLSASVSELHGDKVQLCQEIEELQLMVTKLTLLLQGHRRERHTDDPNQMKLDLGEDADAALQEAAAEAEEIIQEYVVKRKLKPKKPRNEKLPEHLERYEVRLPVADDVANCAEHGPRKQIGEDR